MSDSKGTISRRGFGRSIAAIGTAGAIGGFHIGKAWAQGRRKVVFLFDVSPYGKHALFYPALENVVPWGAEESEQILATT